MIYNLLFDWQQDIVNSVKDKTRFGLFLDCGLGKTPVSMALAEHHGSEKILIITINSKAEEDETVNGSWLNWATHLDGDYQLVSKKKLKKGVEFTDKTVAVVNYEWLSKKSKNDGVRRKKPKVDLVENLQNFIKSCKGKSVTMIIDESHKMKDPNSLQTLSINKIDLSLRAVSKSYHAYLLTGTPFTTGFIDLYTQLKFLGCPLLKGEFIDRFCIRAHIGGLAEWQQPIKAYKNINELYDLVHKYALTIKSDAVIKLPEKIFIPHKQPMTESFELLTSKKIRGFRLANKLQEVGVNDSRVTSVIHKQSLVENLFFRNIAYPSEEWIADTVTSFWLRARQMSIGFQGNADEYLWYENQRLTELRQFLEQNPDNYIIFYNYTPELIEIFNICYELGYKIDTYSGDVKSMVYYDQYENTSIEERLTSEKRVIIANFASGSTGKNWQCYSKCIMFSIPLYRDYEQAVKRINRIGQNESTFYHILIGDNWLDVSMWEALQKNCQYTEEMFKQNLIKNGGII